MYISDMHAFKPCVIAGHVDWAPIDLTISMLRALLPLALHVEGDYLMDTAASSQPGGEEALNVLAAKTAAQQSRSLLTSSSRDGGSTGRAVGLRDRQRQVRV